jgi:glutamate/tyrosine decarboxylase-like PLP-dependent enzyme
MRELGALAHDRGVPLHIDGARFWNTVVALDEDPRELAGPADSVTFCLSKGLACPIGSVVVGSKDFIWRARRARKLIGGGMRQVGVLAAAGLVALRDGDAGMIDRLAEDHANARFLAEALADLPGIQSPGGTAQPTEGRLDPQRVRTNFVLFRVERDREAFLAALERRDVLMLSFMPHNGQIRAVTHYGIDRSHVEATVRAVNEALDELPPTQLRAVRREARAHLRPWLAQDESKTRADRTDHDACKDARTHHFVSVRRRYCRLGRPSGLPVCASASCGRRARHPRPLRVRLWLRSPSSAVVRPNGRPCRTCSPLE